MNPKTRAIRAWVRGMGVGLVCRLCPLGVTLAMLAPVAAWAEEEFRDPTRPPDVSAPAARSDQGEETREWILTSVLVSGQRRVAVLNGRQVSAGDEIDGARVVEVNTTGVTLAYGTQRFTVPMVRAVKSKSSRRETNQ